MTSLDDYSYDLPTELIAQHPANPREAARLMVLPSCANEIIHDHIKNFVSYLCEGDVVVLNNTKVFKARLKATVQKDDGTNRHVEVFLIKPLIKNAFQQPNASLNPNTLHTKNHQTTSKLQSKKILNQVQDDSKEVAFDKIESIWQAMGKPGKHILAGAVIQITDDFFGTVVKKHSDGTFLIAFPYAKDQVIACANQYGSVPTPPYIKEQTTEAQYQTVYAKNIGSVAAPTAGFHITDTILTQMKAKRVQIVEITLHVGLGTFLPIKTDTIEEHTMHNEWVDVSQKTTDAINTAKKEGRRIIAIGTTSVRALEGAYRKQIANNCSPTAKSPSCAATHDAQQSKQVSCSQHSPSLSQARFQEIRLPNTNNPVSPLEPFTGDVNLFITPGFEFHIVDCLLTNFHLPKSTLLLLVSAFAGKEKIKKAYKKAIQKNYRFFSFGDAMFLEHSMTMKK